MNEKTKDVPFFMNYQHQMIINNNILYFFIIIIFWGAQMKFSTPKKGLKSPLVYFIAYSVLIHQRYDQISQLHIFCNYPAQHLAVASSIYA